MIRQRCVGGSCVRELVCAAIEMEASSVPANQDSEGMAIPAQVCYY